MDSGTNNETRFSAAGQNQIIAKTLLIICGIFLALRTISFGIVIQGQLFYKADTEGIINGIGFIIVSVLFICCVLYFLVFNNNRLVKKILPDEDPLPFEKQKLWFATSLKIGLVFYGLVSFAGSIESQIYTAKIIIGLPMLGKQLISNILQGSKWFEDTHLLLHIYYIIITCFIAYLVAGAPGFVRWITNKEYKIDNGEL